MKAAVLVKTGDAKGAFAIREVSEPIAKSNEVLIKVEGFGLNYADVMARRGMYADAPKIPAILGYDVVGRIVATGSQVQSLKVGDRVTAMTRFGGYAEYAVANELAVAVIGDTVPAGEATALTTQYCTAYYCAAEVVKLHAGDKVLVQSAAGGVGTALLQYALYKGCEVWATAGSDSKLELLRKAGAQHVINYAREDFGTVIMQQTSGQGVDVIWDAVGGSNVKRGFKALGAGGKLVCYGASEISNRNLAGKIATLAGFGIYHPLQLMTGSKSLIGVNMLRIADHKPAVLGECLKEVVRLYNEGVLSPIAGASYPVNEIGEAHEWLEGRKSVGKITMLW